jgi:hypothetical protein
MRYIITKCDNLDHFKLTGMSSCADKHSVRLYATFTVSYLAHSAKTELEEECKTIHKVQATRLHSIKVLKNEVPHLRRRIQQKKLKPFPCDHWAPIFLVTAHRSLDVTCFTFLMDSALYVGILLVDELMTCLVFHLGKYGKRLSCPCP